jgi:N-methylhydantoinase A
MAEEGVDDLMRQVHEDISAEARDMLSRSGISEENWDFRYSIDMRYGHQAYELTVPVGESEIREGALDAMAERFHAQHFTTYDYNAPDEPIQLVNLRVSAIGKFGADFIASRASGGNGTGTVAPRSQREVYFKESGRVSCPVYDRGDLNTGVEIKGPAVIQESSSTVVIYPGQSARATEFGTIEITV